MSTKARNLENIKGSINTAGCASSNTQISTNIERNRHSQTDCSSKQAAIIAPNTSNKEANEQSEEKMSVSQAEKEMKAIELLKELKIRGGASRNCVFSNAAKIKNKGEYIDNNKEEGKDLPPKNKLSTGQEIYQSSNLRNKKTNGACCFATNSGLQTKTAVTPLSARSYLYRIGVQTKSHILFQTLNCSTKDCVLCSQKKSVRYFIMKNLEKKYRASSDVYNAKVINDIVYNENTHIVVVFKDYLILDDSSEFLKRYYTQVRGQSKTWKNV